MGREHQGLEAAGQRGEDIASAEGSGVLQAASAADRWRDTQDITKRRRRGRVAGAKLAKQFSLQLYSGAGAAKARLRAPRTSIQSQKENSSYQESAAFKGSTACEPPNHDTK